MLRRIPINNIKKMKTSLSTFSGRKVSIALLSLAFVLLVGLPVLAQDAENRSPGQRPRDDMPRGFKEMLTKKRIEQAKKDHAELLERGDEAIRLTDQLEQSFEQNQQLSDGDRQRLDQLTTIVKKIRKELGASDDGSDDGDVKNLTAEENPSDLKTAFKALQSTTIKLVDELKKHTRFTISAVAVQSSNALLRIVKFIRHGK